MSETWRCAKHIVRSSLESWGALCAGRSLIAARRRCAVVVIDIYCGQRVCHQCVTFDDESQHIYDVQHYIHRFSHSAAHGSAVNGTMCLAQQQVFDLSLIGSKANR